MALSGALQGMTPGEGVEFGSFTPVAATTLIYCTKLGYVKEAFVLPGAALTLTHMFDAVIALRPNGDHTFGIAHYQPTAANDVTPINATVFHLVRWVAFGDLIR